MDLPSHLAWIETLSPRAIDVLARKAEQSLASRRLELYRPHPKQRDFHEAGATYRERLLMAGNRYGKTTCAAAEAAFHLTGRYPDWWRGKVFHRPQQALVASETSLLTRDGPQRVLFGTPAGPMGTGMIPRDAIVDVASAIHGPVEFYEHVRIRYGGGGDIQPGESVLYQRSYDQGRERIQAMELSWIWLDEEPPEDYYYEALTRTNTTLGPVMLTFTPLKGMSKIVRRFLLERPPGTTVVKMGLRDALHIPERDHEAIIQSYPEHERRARVDGEPVLGSGLVFGGVPEEAVRYESFPIPPHWARIAGIDFGFSHPTAIVWIAHDRDTDTAYVYDCYRVSGGLPPIHAAALLSRGAWIPVAWPKDGENETAAGPAIAEQYRKLGVKMLPEYAQFLPVNDRPDQNTVAMRTSVEAGVQMMLQRMLDGRLKVASHLSDWWEEYRLYHRKEGKIVKVLDDLLCATRYALLCLDRAEVSQHSLKRLDPNRRYNWRAG